MKRKSLPVPLLVLAALLGVGALVVAWQYREQISMDNVRLAIEHIAELGPFVFFAAMAILPLFWVPVSPFLFLASVFGTATGIGGCLLAMAINMTISWLVSAKWFRPFFEKLINRMGYSIPVVSQESMMGVALMLRITPGIPFPLQNYLLGLAQMPYLKYMLVSLPTTMVIVSGVVLFGDAIVKGDMKLALLALGFIAALTVGLRHLRKRMNAKREEEATSGNS